MSIAISKGRSGQEAVYEVADDQLAVGSTLGSPKAVTIIKATGALRKVFSTDLGVSVFGALVLRRYDEKTGMYLAPQPGGTYSIHPEHQVHRFALAGHVAVEEDIFVLSGEPAKNGDVDPPGVYISVSMRNEGREPIRIATYAFCELRGDTAHDVTAEYDETLKALVAANRSNADLVRILGCSDPAKSFETTTDAAKAVSGSSPGLLSGKTVSDNNPLGVLHHSHALQPGEMARFHYLLSFGSGRAEAANHYRACPPADEALARTKAYYDIRLQRSIVLTPNPEVNRGVLWAKANMLRILIKSPTGWCFVNDPTRSNNSVSRDTAWFAFGADYVIPEFSRDSLLSYVSNQEKNGLIVEYYDIRDGQTADYRLNVNDNTPLLILALWHHYNTAGDPEFLKEVYPAAVKAARLILSQRNEQGLVWCTADATSDWGIAGWRNVIQGYRLSGATTEVNSECYAALHTVSQMARVLDKHDESGEFAAAADALRDAINTHLLNPSNGLYYLNIDIDGQVCSDVTSDLVFPVMFGVASEETAARIISRLSDNDFWTSAGIRTTPRDAPAYDPDGSNNGPYGLLGGVWLGVSFWYAFAAAPYNAEFMDHALTASFRNYSSDPRRNNTVPGQFSEWLHGETLVNQGMMLSPWFPPRYLWAAVEGVAGFSAAGDRISVKPCLAPHWKWLGIQGLPYRGRELIWLVVRMPDLQIYSNFQMHGGVKYETYDEDISRKIAALGNDASVLGFRQGKDLLLFVGSTSERTVTTSVRVEIDLAGSFRMRSYHSLLGAWRDEGVVSAEALRRGHVLEIERRGFSLLELTQQI